MAENKKISKAKDSLNDPERFKLGEIGSLGIRMNNGISDGEIKRDLNFPRSVDTFKSMSYHGTINSSLTLFDTIVAKATWSFKPPKDATEEELKQVQYINEMMLDMETPWSEFICDVMSANTFGFSVHEKVYRRRYISNGSAHNDGLIGWKKLPIRAQESIEKFTFSDDGTDITGVKQNLTGLNDPYNQYKNRTNGNVVLPKSKIIHFRVGKHRGDPYGKSPLRDAYVAWRFITALEELEATGVSKDLTGLPVLYMPPQYLSADASPEQLAVRSYYENAMRNLQMNAQSAMILPLIYDVDAKAPMFKIDVLDSGGKKSFDIDRIKLYYKNSIVTSLFSDVLTQGQSTVGSFALGSLKNSMSGAVAAQLAKGIIDTLDRDLIKQTYELNGWDISRRGSLDIDNMVEVDLETMSKYFQRVSSVGLIEKDREVLNAVRVAAGIDPLPDDLPPQNDLITPDTSRAGDGMATPFDGTGTSGNVGNDNANNLDNTA